MGAGSSSRSSPIATIEIGAHELQERLKKDTGVHAPKARITWLLTSFAQSGGNKLSAAEYKQVRRYVEAPHSEPSLCTAELQVAWSGSKVSKRRLMEANTLDNQVMSAMVKTASALPPVQAAETATAAAVPLDLEIAEFQARRQATVKQLTAKAKAEAQLRELTRRREFLERVLTGGEQGEWLGNFKKALSNCNKAIGKLEHERGVAEEETYALIERTHDQQMETISRFTPALLGSVLEYETVFNELVATPKEEAAVRDLAGVHVHGIGGLRVQSSGQEGGGGSGGGGDEKDQDEEAAAGVLCPIDGSLPTQPLRDGVPSELSTLLQLMRDAEAASDPLKQIVTEAVAKGGGGGGGTATSRTTVVGPSLKGVERSLQKTQEEYGGCYDRLLDLCRATIVFDGVQELVAALRWLLTPSSEGGCALFSWRPVRSKDRLSWQVSH